MLEHNHISKYGEPREMTTNENQAPETSFTFTPLIDMRVRINTNLVTDGGKPCLGEFGRITKVWVCDGWQAVAVELENGETVSTVFGVDVTPAAPPSSDGDAEAACPAMGHTDDATLCRWCGGHASASFATAMRATHVWADAYRWKARGELEHHSVNEVEAAIVAGEHERWDTKAWNDLGDDARDFLENNAEDVARYLEHREPNQLAHDFALSRNGHGSGLFEHAGRVGLRLHEIARAYGPLGLICDVADCGEIRSVAVLS